MNITKLIYFEEGPENLASLVSILLNKGGIIGYPTETVYGLGCDACNEKAVQRIYRLKGRPADKAFPLLVRDAEAARGWIESAAPVAEKLMEAFWPGSLTLLFRASSRIKTSAVGGDGRIGLRVSPDPVCRAITSALDSPLVSTSANPAGASPAQCAEELQAMWSEGIDLIVDDGRRETSAGSTILDVTRTTPLLIREGALALKQIQKVIGEVDEIKTL